MMTETLPLVAIIQLRKSAITNLKVHEGTECGILLTTRSNDVIKPRELNEQDLIQDSFFIKDASFVLYG